MLKVSVYVEVVLDLHFLFNNEASSKLTPLTSKRYSYGSLVGGGGGGVNFICSTSPTMKKSFELYFFPVVFDVTCHVPRVAGSSFRIFTPINICPTSIERLHLLLSHRFCGKLSTATSRPLIRSKEILKFKEFILSFLYLLYSVG